MKCHDKGANVLTYLLTYLLTIPDVESSHAPFGDPSFYPTFFSND